jgi:hypothetical protein
MGYLGLFMRAVGKKYESDVHRTTVSHYSSSAHTHMRIGTVTDIVEDAPNQEGALQPLKTITVY